MWKTIYNEDIYIYVIYIERVLIIIINLMLYHFLFKKPDSLK